MGQGVRIERLSRSGDRRLDIVFVHGLTGDLFETWAIRGEDKKLGPPWPAMLDRFFPDVGVFTVGYPAPSSANPRRPLDNLTNTAQAVVAEFIENQIGTRPYLVVAHSLGGLITKECLIQSSLVSSSDPRAGIASNLRSVVFLGTPHDGAALANLALRVLPKPSPFVRVLRAQNEHVTGLRDKFIEFASARSLETWSVVEREAIEVTVLGIFKHYTIVVPELSALAGYGKRKTLEANHNEMTRIRSERDPLFTFVVDLVGRQLSAAVGPSLTAPLTLVSPVGPISGEAAAAPITTDTSNLQPTVFLPASSLSNSPVEPPMSRSLEDKLDEHIANSLSEGDSYDVR